MKSLILLSILFFFNAAYSFGQVSLQKLSLENGAYQAGFKHYLTHDSSRTYSRVFEQTNRKMPRPIPVSIWYPAENIIKNRPRLAVLDYMEILKEEEEWEHLPNDFILSWFYYPDTEENRNHLKEETTAKLNAEPVSRKFPVIIYAPSYQASSTENFALCEFLASHGYVVISSPSRGTENRFLEGATEKDMETQARDIEFLIKEVKKQENVDPDKIATMGFSFGGLSNVLSQMRNAEIKAIVSLDGSIKYQYETLQKSPFANIEKADVPFIHMAQKDIPEEVMAADKIDTTLNNRFVFYDSLVYSRAYSLKFHNLTHSCFSTMGVLLQPRDPRQDKSDREIMESYKWVSVYTLHFFNAYLKGDKESLKFIEREPAANNIPAGLISKRSKLPAEKQLSFEDFNEQAAAQDYRDLFKLYGSVRAAHAGFELPEGKLNQLGLHLVFNPQTAGQGINVFLLAIKLYPASANLFDSLAEAYLYTGNKKLAIKNFEKSLELNPQNQNAINRLKELRG